MTDQEKVVRALQSTEYEWRTEKGIAAEAKLTTVEVRTILANLGDQVAKSIIPSTTGEALYTLSSRVTNSVPTQAEMVAVLQALNSDKYQWRTISGVATETNLTQEKVANAIAAQKDVVLQSTVPAETGEELYATRESYLRGASGLTKMASFFRGRL